MLVISYASPNMCIEHACNLEKEVQGINYWQLQVQRVKELY